MFKLLALNPISTKNKPGTLIDINIETICAKYDISNFSISKCFYITDLNSTESRGNHSNTNASEILICQEGSFTIKLHDGNGEIIMTLSKHDGIFIDRNVWVEFYDFTNCVILAFVSIEKDVKRSCYDFGEFLQKHNTCV